MAKDKTQEQLLWMASLHVNGEARFPTLREFCLTRHYKYDSTVISNTVGIATCKDVGCPGWALAENFKGGDVIIAMFHQGWQCSLMTFTNLELRRLMEMVFYKSGTQYGEAQGTDFNAVTIDAAVKALEAEQKP